MDYVKDNWVEGEVFKDSDLNNIARTLNELADKRENIINDTEAGDNSVYSSNKIEEEAEAAKASVINDEEVSQGSTCSSSKVLETIERSKFKAAIVDELPEVGEENTIYFTPKEEISDIYYKAPMLMYNGENDVITIDMDFFGSEEVDALSGISIGDVIRYKAPDLEEQTFLKTYYDGKNSVSTEDTLFSGKYNVGDTFYVESMAEAGLLITSYNNISINYSSIYGITGSILSEGGKIYRMTGYEQIPDESVEESDGFHAMYNVYVATFEDVTGAVSEADHEVFNLGSIFTMRKPLTKQYTVLSEIDKDELMGTVNVSVETDGGILLNVTNGVLGTLALQDGHCYRLIDRYTLKGKNMGGNAIIVASLYGYVPEALIYEEVPTSVIAKYDNMSFVPGAITSIPSICNGKIRRGCYSSIYSGIYTANAEYAPFDIPVNLKEGDVLKIIGENPIAEFIDKCFCVTGVGENLCVRGDIGFELIGITDAVEWEKGECYRLTQLIKLNNGHLSFEEGMPEEMLDGKFIEGVIPVFENVSNPEKIDHEVNGLPGLIISVIGAKQTRDKWMWINGKWERIGGPSIDEELDENIVPDNNNENELSLLQ